jgi:hypothetical protein
VKRGLRGLMQFSVLYDDIHHPGAEGLRAKLASTAS